MYKFAKRAFSIKETIEKAAESATKAVGGAQTYKLPSLPYDLNALEPVINHAVLDVHYNGHHKTYVDKLNKAVEQADQHLRSGDLAALSKDVKEIRINGGGHINHSIFWTNLAPPKNGGGEPPAKDSALLKQINTEWGSLDKFITDFNERTVAVYVKGSFNFKRDLDGDS